MLAYPRGKKSAMHFSTTSVIQGSARKVLRDSYLMISILCLFGATVALFSAVFSLPAAGLIPVLIGSATLLWMTGRNREPVWGVVTLLGFIGLAAYALSSLINLCLSPGNGPQVVTSALAVTGLIFFCKALFAHSKNYWDVTDFEQAVLAGLVVFATLFATAYLFQLSSLALTMSVILIMLTSSPTMIAIQAIVRGGETNSVDAVVAVFVALVKWVSKADYNSGLLVES